MMSSATPPLFEIFALFQRKETPCYQLPKFNYTTHLFALQLVFLYFGYIIFFCSNKKSPKNSGILVCYFFNSVHIASYTESLSPTSLVYSALDTTSLEGFAAGLFTNSSSSISKAALLGQR